MNEFDLKIEITASKDNPKVYDLFEINSINLDEVYGNIYCEQKYKIRILNLVDVDTVDLYINNQYIDDSDDGYFNIGRAFFSYYGSIFLTIVVNGYDDVKYYKSKIFHACFPQNSNIEVSIENMIEYIVENNHIIEATNNNIIKKDSNDYKGDNSKPFYNEILSKIYDIYNKNYKYFLNRPHKTFDKTNEISDFEKLSVINSDTLIHILSNPDELVLTDVDTGISFEGNFYYPRKTKVNNLDINLKNYENEVIVAFLTTILQYLIKTESDINYISKNSSTKVNIPNGYISSSDFLVNSVQKNITKIKEDISVFKLKFKVLLNKYVDLFKIKPIPLSAIPKQTRVFASVGHYRDIYFMILYWFKNSEYLLENEKLNLDLAKSDLLYEHYLLLKLINSFIDYGYEFKSKSILSYDVLDDRYVNIAYNNTFEFEREGITKIIYYQPVINTTSNLNGINLYRSVDYSYNGMLQNEPYYTPDYIVKTIDSEQNESYTIVDAKFSRSTDILRYSIENLVYKYVFSVNPTCENVSLNGFVAICGKRDNNKNNINMHSIEDYSNFNDKNKNFSILTLDPVDELYENNHHTLLEDILFS